METRHNGQCQLRDQPQAAGHAIITLTGAPKQGWGAPKQGWDALTQGDSVTIYVTMMGPYKAGMQCSVTVLP